MQICKTELFIPTIPHIKNNSGTRHDAVSAPDHRLERCQGQPFLRIRKISGYKQTYSEKNLEISIYFQTSLLNFNPNEKSMDFESQRSMRIFSNIKVNYPFF